MNSKRAFLAAGFAAAAVTVATLTGPRPAVAQRGAPKVTIGRARLDGSRFAGGGRVRILTVPITPARGTVIRSVRGRVDIARAAGAADALANIGGNNFGTGGGGLAIGNPAARRASAQVIVIVEAEAGGAVRTFEKSVGTISVERAVVDPTQPPPPPPI